MAYKDQYVIAADTDFVHAVTIAAVDYCRTVVAEPGTTTNHANRVLLMKGVLADPEFWGRRFAYAVAMLGATNNPITADAQLKTYVGQVWDAYSGV